MGSVNARKRDFWNFSQKYFRETPGNLLANLILPSGSLNKAFSKKPRLY